MFSRNALSLLSSAIQDRGEQSRTIAAGFFPDIDLTTWDMRHTTSRARRDLVLIGLLTAVFCVLSVSLDLSERLSRWTLAQEWLQLDELPQVLLVLAALLSWFAWRRMLELRDELARRAAAERQLAAALAENRRLGRQALDMQEAERRVLAREMHDELGQYLVAIRLDGTAIREGADSGRGGTLDAAARIVRHVDHVQAAVRDIIRRLRPPGLDELGLAAALENCLEDWRRRLPGVDIQLLTRGELDALGEDVSLALYRLAQECLTNVSRHAGATRVQIGLDEERQPEGARTITFSATDDGRGTALPPAGAGFGLAGMRERVLSLGGTFRVDSQPGAGFRVQATIRLAMERRDVQEAQSDAA
jgi:two-component system, NarL family, sensor histidine kinase UhpB